MVPPQPLSAAAPMRIDVPYKGAPHRAAQRIRGALARLEPAAEDASGAPLPARRRPRQTTAHIARPPPRPRSRMVRRGAGDRRGAAGERAQPERVAALRQWPAEARRATPVRPAR